MERLLDLLFRDREGQAGSGVAVTDLWDSSRGERAVRYRVRVFVVLAIWGFVALALLGFLGYVDDPRWTRVGSETLVYLWICALLMLLLLSIVRHPSLVSVRRAAVSVGLGSIILVGVLYLLRDDIILWLKGVNVDPTQIVESPTTYIVINFGLILAFLAFSLRRFVRHARHLPLYPQVDIGLASSRAEPEAVEQVQTSELVAGDMLAGAAICALLALIVYQSVFTAIWNALQLQKRFPHIPQLEIRGISLSVFDIGITLGFVVAGLLALLIAGLAQVFAGGAQGGPKPFWESILEAVLEAVRLGFIKRWDELLRYFAASWRFLWPLILFCAFAFAAVTTYTLRPYLHGLSVAWTCPILVTPGSATYNCPDAFVLDAVTGKPISEFTSEFLNAHAHQDIFAGAQYMGLTVGFGILALLLVLVALSLLLFRGRIFTNSLRFLAWAGGALLLLFLFWTLALSALNKVYELVAVTILQGPRVRWPFPQPSLGLYISGGAWVLALVLLVVGRLRRWRIPKPRAGK